MESYMEKAYKQLYIQTNEDKIFGSKKEWLFDEMWQLFQEDSDAKLDFSLFMHTQKTKENGKNHE